MAGSSPNCSWKLHVSKGKTQNNNQWTVRSEKEYFCMEHINCAYICNASVKVLQQSYSTSMVSGNTKPMNFLSTTSDTGVLYGRKMYSIVHPKYNHATKKGYDKAYRAVHQINQCKIEPFIDSFGYLPEYATLLGELNPGSVVTLQGEDTGDVSDSGNQRFVRMFVMLGAQAVCAANCKPVISYDGGFLKTVLWGRYQILVVACPDGENKDCIVSLTLAHVENAENYIWTMEGQAEHEEMNEFLHQLGLIVNTGSDKGLQSAIAKILLKCVARFCNRHLLGNLPGGSFSNKEGVPVKYYWCAVKAETEEDFLSWMDKIRAIRPEAYTYLMNEKTLPRSMWADYAFLMPTWHTNNLVERSINWMGVLRAKGPVSLYATMVMEQRAERLILAEERIQWGSLV